jgi:hypothetical protein
MKRGVIAVLVPLALVLPAPLSAGAQEAAPAVPAISEAPQAAPAQDDTTTDEAPTNDLQGNQGNDDNIPQQYTDPLAGEDNDSGGQQGQAETVDPVATAPAVQTTTAGQLPQTGAPLDGIWIAGLVLLATGTVLRFALRRREYPYPLPRY